VGFENINPLYMLLAGVITGVTAAFIVRLIRRGPPRK